MNTSDLRTRRYRSAQPIAAFATALLLLFGAAFAFSQPTSQNPLAPGQATTSPGTVRILSRLVQVNVVVQDKDGNPVSDLTKDDFTILDKGEPQQIAYFTQPSTNDSLLLSARASAESPSNFFSNRVQNNSEGTNTVTVILMDAVSTDFLDLAYVREQVLSFVKSIRPQDQVALYLLAPSRLCTLHDFTNDSATLVRMLGGIADAGSASTSRTSSADAATRRANRLISDAFAEANHFYKGGPTGIIENTSDAMAQIARNVANIPGRKSLVWISSGFPLYIGENSPIGERSERHDFSPLISATARMLGNANMAVYTVDARGLIAPPGGRPYASPNYDAMIMIANGTGGHAYYNTNDITGSIRHAIDDSSSSYVLSYYPTHNNWDYSFRPIGVKVARKGLQLRYRTGYYAMPNSSDGDGMHDHLIADAIRSPIQMMDLGLEVRADAIDASGRRELKIQMRVEPSEMNFQKDGDHWTDSVDLVWAALSADGRILEKDGDRIALRQEQSAYEEIQRAGFPFTKSVRLPSNSVELRLVVRDNGTGAIGSVNIPLTRLMANAKTVAPPAN
jgi:VWFA-related protein